jgi:hypothetical protein
MQVELGQRGRASLEFQVDFSRSSGMLEPKIQADIAAAGIAEDTLAEDLGERLAQMDAALATSEAFHQAGCGAADASARRRPEHYRGSAPLPGARLP